MVSEHAIKGSKLYVEGASRTRTYQGKDGIERYITEVHVREFRFIGPRPEGVGQGSGQRNAHAPSQGSPAAQAESQPAFDNFYDDIPF